MKNIIIVMVNVNLIIIFVNGKTVMFSVLKINNGNCKPEIGSQISGI